MNQLHIERPNYPTPTRSTHRKPKLLTDSSRQLVCSSSSYFRREATGVARVSQRQKEPRADGDRNQLRKLAAAVASPSRHLVRKTDQTSCLAAPTCRAGEAAFLVKQNCCSGRRSWQKRILPQKQRRGWILYTRYNFKWALSFLFFIL